MRTAIARTLRQTFKHTTQHKLNIKTNIRTLSNISQQTGGCENCACQQAESASTTSTTCSTTSSSKPARVKCDPYSQGGHPLEPNVVQTLLKTLDKGWQTNEKHLSLTRQFDFREVGQSAMFAFTTSLQNVTINGGHPFYSMQLIPRKLRVEVELHTVSLHGLSYADFAFATQCDGTYRRLARVNGS